MQALFKEIHVLHFICIIIIKHFWFEPVLPEKQWKEAKGTKSRGQSQCFLLLPPSGGPQAGSETPGASGIPISVQVHPFFPPPGRAPARVPLLPPPSRLLPYPTLSTTRHPACQASLYIKIINIDHMNYSYSPVWHIRLNVMVILKVENVEFYITGSLNVVN